MTPTPQKTIQKKNNSNQNKKKTIQNKKTIQIKTKKNNSKQKKTIQIKNKKLLKSLSSSTS